jgi:hypothetical protein
MKQTEIYLAARHVFSPFELFILAVGFEAFLGVRVAPLGVKFAA